MNYGCTPTKTMIASARAAHVARTAGRLGVHVADVRVDLSAVVDRKSRVVKQWRDGIVRRLERAGSNLTTVFGHARFIGEREIEVSGKAYSADLIVINAGARPAVPPLPGLESVPHLDNASMPFGHIARAIELDEMAGILKVLLEPKTERVLGAAIVGLEAGELIHVFVALMRAGASARALVDGEMVHPTLAEGLQSVLMRLRRYTLYDR